MENKRVFSVANNNKTLIRLNQIIEQNPQDAKAFAQRGEFYRQSKYYAEALADFNQAIALKPDYAWAIAHRGVTYRRLMRYEEALIDLNQAIALKPDYAWAIAYRGVIYVIMCRYEAAVNDYNQAVALDKTFMSHWGNERGFPLMCLGRYAEALECYEQTLSVRPNDPIALYCIAVTQVLWQGLNNAQIQIKKARTVFLSILDNLNTNSSYGRDVAFYGLGGLAALDEHTEQALNYLQKAIQFDENQFNREMVPFDPAWQNLKNHQLFQALLIESHD